MRITFTRFLYLLFLFLPVSVIAQQKVTSADSIRLLLKQPQSDSLKAVHYCLLAEALFRTEPAAAAEACREGVKYAKKASLPLVQARALNTLGVSYLIQADFDKAFKCHHEALQLRRNNQDSSGIAASLLNLGNLYHKMSDYPRCLEYYQQALEISQASKDKKNQARLFNNIGSVHELQGDLKKALSYFKRSAALKEELGDRMGLAVSLGHIGKIYAASGNINEGLVYMKRALALDEETGNDISRVVVYREMAALYQQLNMPEQSLRSAHLGLDLAQKLNSKSEIMFASEQLQQIYASRNQYNKAYEFLKLSSLYYDSLNNESTLAQRNEIEIRYHTKNKELENARLKAEKELQAHKIEQSNTIVLLESIAAGLLVLLSGVLFLSWRRMKSQNLQLTTFNSQILLQNNEIEKHRRELALQTEKIMVQRDELSKLNLFKNRVFSIISHDLRGPFASLQSLLFMIQDNRLTEAETRKFLQLLTEKLGFASNMLNNILFWASSQINGDKLILEPVQVADLLKQHITLLATETQKKNITIQPEIEETVWVLAEKERLNFVLRNLFSNAVKFSFSNSKILVQSNRQNDLICISVTDSGCGISHENQQKFLNNERFTTKGTASEKGTGIGLLLCKELLENINGTLHLESNPHEGTVFYITLQGYFNSEEKESVQALEEIYA